MERISLFALVLLFGCSGLEDSEREKVRKMNATGEYIHRMHDEWHFASPTPLRKKRENYPWEDTYIGNQIRINKEFFRCRGSANNGPHIKMTPQGQSYIFDCGGTLQHSLPLKGGREFIYPALIDLLNYIQEKTQKKVVISCGYRCPTHNAYADSSSSNRISKHMIGAEVDFYIKGLEWSPHTAISLIQSYYREKPEFAGQADFCNFKRWEGSTNVSTMPWYNKEIFVKLFNSEEGRDFDNDHGFPYISIQLKWDREEKTPVRYSWDSAFTNYLRY